jgi:hypothetical protein
MNDKHQQNEQRHELRDLEVPDEQAGPVSGGKRRVIEGYPPYLVVTLKEARVSS